MTDGKIWFPEPAPDAPEPRQSKRPTDWIASSHRQHGRAMREFLNRNISLLPGTFQPVIFRELHSRWHSAYFELIVARTLQILGAALEVEPLGKGTTLIDYVATFSDGEIAVEAMAPLFSVAEGIVSRDRMPLLDILRSLRPAGWYLHVFDLPNIGPQDSKIDFKKAAREMLAGELPDENGEWYNLEREMPSGIIHLAVMRDDSGNDTFISSMAQYYSDSEERIRIAVNDRRKRRQGRNAAIPALLAIGHPISNGWTHLRDFDAALYGERIVNVFADGQDIFRPTGEFLKRAINPPPYVGVLAFPHVGLDNADEPVLYHDPRSTSPLPQALSILQQRRFHPERQEIIIEKAKNLDIIKQLEFIPRDL